MPAAASVDADDVAVDADDAGVDGDLAHSLGLI